MQRSSKFGLILSIAMVLSLCSANAHSASAASADAPVVQLARTNGQIMAISEMPNGQILIGGDFTKVNDVVRLGLARLNSNGTLDESFTAEVPGPLIPGTLDVETKKLTIDKSPNAPMIPNYFTRVWAILDDADGYLVVADNSNYGSNHFGFLRLKQNGSLDTAYRSKYSGNLGFAPIRILRLPNGKVAVGGLSGNPDGSSSIRVAILDENGDFDSQFSHNPSDPKFAYGGFLGMSYLADGSILLATGAPTTGEMGSAANPCLGVLKLSPNGIEDTAWENLFANVKIEATDGQPARFSAGRASGFAQFPDGKVLVALSIGTADSLLKTKGCNGGRSSLVLLNSDGSLNTKFQDRGLSPQTAFSARIDGDKFLLQMLLEADGAVTVINSDGSIDQKLHNSKLLYDEVFQQSAGIFSTLNRYALVAGNSINTLLSGNQENYVLRKVWLQPSPPRIDSVECKIQGCTLTLIPPTETGVGFEQKYTISVTNESATKDYSVSGTIASLPPQAATSKLQFRARALNSSGTSQYSDYLAYTVPIFPPLVPKITSTLGSDSVAVSVTSPDFRGEAPSSYTIARVNTDGSTSQPKSYTYGSSTNIPREKIDFQVIAWVTNSAGDSEKSIAINIKAKEIPKIKIITCVKGKSSKKVSAVNPKCPTGYRKSG